MGPHSMGEPPNEAPKTRLLSDSRFWVPNSCVNISQRKAIEREYSPITAKSGLADHSVPPVPIRLTNENRRKAIMDEIAESKARILLLLGDKPIQWFLSYFDNRWSKLSDFGYDITVVPLYINFGDQSFLDGVDISRQEFYERLPGSDPLPTTATPGLDAFLNTYQRLAEVGACTHKCTTGCAGTLSSHKTSIS